jgi:DNA-binding MarR family transcriptional regulator
MARRRAVKGDGPDDQAALPGVYRESVSFLLTATANEIVSSTSFLLLNVYGIGIIEQRILSLLRLEPNIRIRRVCHVSRMDKSVVSRAFTRLEKKGYVARSGGGADGRRALWALTPSGAELCDRLSVHLARRQALLTNNFSPVEQAALIVLLQKILNNVALFTDYSLEEIARANLGEHPGDPARSR